MFVSSAVLTLDLLRSSTFPKVPGGRLPVEYLCEPAASCLFALFFVSSPLRSSSQPREQPDSEVKQICCKATFSSRLVSHWAQRDTIACAWALDHGLGGFEAKNNGLRDPPRIAHPTSSRCPGLVGQTDRSSSTPPMSFTLRRCLGWGWDPLQLVRVMCTWYLTLPEPHTRRPRRKLLFDHLDWMIQHLAVLVKPLCLPKIFTRTKYFRRWSWHDSHKEAFT